MKIGFISLGCPKNQLDTEVMLHEVVEAGYEVTPEDIDADIIIINTCAFIESARKEAVDNILDVAWLKENRHLKGIIVTGCLAERYREEIFEEMPEVDALLGVGSIHRIVDAVRAVEAQVKAQETAKKSLDAACKYRSFEDKNTVELGGDRVLTTPDYAAYLKIAEGCDNRCAYCAIPYIRGGYRSRPMEELVREAKELSALGVRELTVIAQDITRYGKDLYGHYALHELLHRITEETDIPWIRLLYCYPDKITDELIDVIADEPKIVKYLDIPLQHVSKRILRAMHRPGDGAEFTRLIEDMRERIPGLVLRTSLIVGLPGETEDEFAELCEFLQNVGIERVGVFEYSPEEGTEAAELPDQIDDETKQNRRLIVEELQSGVLDDYNTSRHGEVMQVLCEGFDEEQDLWYGRTYADSVEVDGHVYFDAADNEPAEGEFVSVLITESLGPDLLGVRQKEA